MAQEPAPARAARVATGSHHESALGLPMDRRELKSGPKQKSRRDSMSPNKYVASQQEEQHMVVARAQKAEMSRPLLQSSLPDSDELDTQLFAAFFDDYLPTGLSPWRQITYLRPMAETVPATSLLKLAKRTMGLAHVGAMSHNERIQQESRVAYGRLLGMLNLLIRFPSMSKYGRSNNVRAILSTMALLTHVNDQVRQRSDCDEADDSWVLHLETAQHLLALQGPQHLNADQTLDKGLIRHICFNSFFLALAKRKAWNPNPAWLTLETKGWSQLLGVFGGLPTLIANTDCALSSGDSVGQLLRYASRLHVMANHAQGLFPQLEEPLTLDMSQVRCLNPKTEEQTVMAKSSAFPRLYAPMSELDAQQSMISTILSLVTQCTILRIWSLCRESTMLIPSEFQRTVEHNVHSLARRLCMLALSFTQKDRVVSAFILRLCLTLAYNVFEQRHATAEMDWCHGCLIANRARLDRILKDNPHTLCKVGAVLPGIAEAGRYGDEFDLRAFTMRDENGTGPDIIQHSRCPVSEV